MEYGAIAERNADISVCCWKEGIMHDIIVYGRVETMDIEGMSDIQWSGTPQDKVWSTCTFGDENGMPVGYQYRELSEGPTWAEALLLI